MKDLTALSALLSDRTSAYHKACKAYSESQAEVTRAGLALKEAIAEAEVGQFFESGGELYQIASREGKKFIKSAVPSKARAIYKGKQ